MVRESTTQHLIAREAPLDAPFCVYERFLRSLETVGGRTLVLLGLVVGGYGASALGFANAENLGAAALIVLLLVLARDPRSPGLLGALLAALKKPG